MNTHFHLSIISARKHVEQAAGIGARGLDGYDIQAHNRVEALGAEQLPLGVEDLDVHRFLHRAVPEHVELEGGTKRVGACAQGEYAAWQVFRQGGIVGCLGSCGKASSQNPSNCRIFAPMKRFFNTTGLCNPEDHYMVDPFRAFYDDILRLIEAKQYFLIHAPRQTGKTTFLHSLAHRLNREGNYVATVCSLESAGYPSISVEDANEGFIRSLYQTADIFLGLEQMPPNPYDYPPSTQLLRQYLTDWCKALTKPLVLLLDEVDALYDDVLISTLRQLRDGFQTRPRNFPQSVALVGLRDIREYRLRARADNPSIGAGSPFNVKAKSFFLPVFSREEVRGLLDQHAQDTGQVFSPAVFEKLYAYSGGQPWLTNALANEIVAELLKNDYTREITPDLVETAKERLIEQRQTHLDSLADKVREERVRKIMMSIISGEALAFDGWDDAVRYCRDLGIITTGTPIQFANPIYREIITRILNSGFAVSPRPTPYCQPEGD
jgi:hypothetical protein